MKKILLLIFYFINNYTYSQDIINPYLEYQGLPSESLDVVNSNIIYTLEESVLHSYTGEYEILLDESNPWGNQYLGNTNAPFNYNNFGLSYQIELVSFPFSVDCAFPSATNPTGGCSQPSDRILNVPADSFYSTNMWEYPYPSNDYEYKLWNKTLLKKFTRHQNNIDAFSDPQFGNALVSIAFVRPRGADQPHSILPHSVLKHTVNIHCGIDITNDPIISSFSWYSDLTRGRMREYPFHYGTVASANLQAWDIITRPEIYNSGFYLQSDNSNCNNPRAAVGFSCNGEQNSEGFSINYTPFDPLQDNYCTNIPTAPNAFNADYQNVSSNYAGVFGIPMQDYTYIFSSSPKNYDGTTLAGYELDYLPRGNLRLIDQSAPIFHKYYIDKNINLSLINNSELTIYNPSEVFITADNLKFPTNYTFKTIRGIYPYASEMKAAEDDLLNGGPFTDPTKQDVPVQTDLYKDFHVNQQYDPNNVDHRYASLYHLISGSKLVIEPCVKIFDATFEINPGSEIVFENWSTNQININRYQLLYSGGTVTKRNDFFLFQNSNETRRKLNWEGGNYIAAGAAVDGSNPTGEYTVEANSHVTFEAANYIDLKSGFYAKDGSEFEASIKNVNIPACGPLRVRNKNSENHELLNPASEITYFTCSPNPAIDKSYLMFEIMEKSTARVSIYDSMGKLIYLIGENAFLPAGKYTYPLLVSDLSPGLYIAKLQTDKGEKSIKFIKQ